MSKMQKIIPVFILMIIFHADLSLCSSVGVSNQSSNISEGKLNLNFSSSVYPCQGITGHFKDNIEEIRWIDETTVIVKAHIIITCHNKIENIGYEFVNDRIILKFQEIGNSMANCVCAHYVIYKFTNLEKKEYKIELIKIK